MGIDACITSSAGQILVLTVWDVEMGLWVTVLLSEPKIDDVNLISTFADAHQEVIGLDVTVDEGFCMNVFNAGNELVR